MTLQIYKIKLICHSKTNSFFQKSTIFTFLTITLKLYLILKFRPIIMCLHLYINMFSTLIYP